MWSWKLLVLLLSVAKTVMAAHFQSDAFQSFLQSYSELQSINSSRCKPNALKPHREYWAYLIGLPSGDSRIQSFSSQLNAKVSPTPILESNEHCITLKDFSKKIIHLLKDKSANDNQNGNTSTPSNGVLTHDPSNVVTCTSPHSLNIRNGSAPFGIASNFQGEQPGKMPIKRALDFDNNCGNAQKKLMHVPCSGIPHNELQVKGLSLPEEGILSLCNRFNLIRGRWHHKDCCGFIVDAETLLTPSLSGSCNRCVAARSSVRVGRVPNLLFSKDPACVADIVHSDERLRVVIGNAAAKFQSVEGFEQSKEAQEFVLLLKIYQKSYINFAFNNSVYALSRCCECDCALVSRKPTGWKRQREEDATACAMCKRKETNERRRNSRFNESHGDPSSRTTYRNLKQSPTKWRLLMRLKGRKRQVKTAKQAARGEAKMCYI
jgi:hypothetical protein